MYQREICWFLSGDTDITECQVSGVPAVRYGEEVMAWVKFRDRSQVTGEQLSEYCRGKISTFKIPRYWKFVDGFPMTVTGKVRKVEMREVSVRDLGLETAAAVSTA